MVAAQATQQAHQRQQVLDSKVCPSSRHDGERIGPCHARAGDWQRAQLALAVVEEHPVLTPGMPQRQQLELLAMQPMKRMRDRKQPSLIYVMRCS